VGIGFSIFLFVIGAILTFAVDVSTRGLQPQHRRDHPDGRRRYRAAAVAAVLEQLLALPPPLGRHLPEERRIERDLT
jgi:hypothetical protein